MSLLSVDRCYKGGNGIRAKSSIYNHGKQTKLRACRFPLLHFTQTHTPRLISPFHSTNTLLLSCGAYSNQMAKYLVTKKYFPAYSAAPRICGACIFLRVTKEVLVLFWQDPITLSKFDYCCELTLYTWPHSSWQCIALLLLCLIFLVQVGNEVVRNFTLSNFDCCCDVLL